MLLIVPQYRSVAGLAGAAGRLPYPPTEQDLKKILLKTFEEQIL